MAGRWYVHRNDQQHGPFMAEEIRQGLRDGHFDPFDLISREGSHVRVELMEIDEIFMHSQIEYMPSAAEQRLDLAAGGGGGVAGGHPGGGGAFLGGAAAEVPAKRRGAAAAQVQPGGMIAIARGPAANRGKADSPKRFFLVESGGRIIGPMAAGEIQAAWAKGGLDKSLMVQKNNSPAKVPIAKFVHLYAMAKINGAQGQTQVTSPMLSQMIRVEAHRLGRIRRWLFPILGFVVLGLAIGVAYTFFKSGRFRKGSAPRRPAVTRTINSPGNQPALPPAQYPSRSPRPAARLPAPRSAPDAAPKSSWRPKPPQKSATPAVKNPPPVYRPAAAAIKPVATRPVTARPSVQVPVPSGQRVARAPVPVRVAQRPAPVPAPVPVPVPVPAPAVAPVAAASSGDDGGEDIKGATFNRPDLDACSMKCKIKFTANGAAVTVVFFKGAFEDQLKSKKGPMTLSGRLSQDPSGGKTLYLQSIK